MMVHLATAGLIAVAGLAVPHADATALAAGLMHRGLPLVAASAVAGLTELGLLYRGCFLPARIAASVAVTAVIWGWAVAQYPYLLPRELTIAATAAGHGVLLATLISLGAGAVLLVPSLALLYATFQRGGPDP